MQRQAQGGVGVHRHAEIAGQQVAGARGQQRHGHAGAGQLGGDGPYRSVPAGHQDEVDAGVERPPGRLVTGIVDGGLQPEGRAPPRGEHLGLDAAPQQRQVVEFGRVENDGGSLIGALAR